MDFTRIRLLVSSLWLSNSGHFLPMRWSVTFVRRASTVRRQASGPVQLQVPPPRTDQTHTRRDRRAPTECMQHHEASGFHLSPILYPKRSESSSLLTVEDLTDMNWDSSSYYRAGELMLLCWPWHTSTGSIHVLLSCSASSDL